MVDITRDKPIKVAVRVVVPVRDHPKVSCQCYVSLPMYGPVFAGSEHILAAEGRIT